jgi:hypothetical protein
MKTFRKLDFSVLSFMMNVLKNILTGTFTMEKGKIKNKV